MGNIKQFMNKKLALGAVVFAMLIPTFAISAHVADVVQGDEAVAEAVTGCDASVYPSYTYDQVWAVTHAWNSSYTCKVRVRANCFNYNEMRWSYIYSTWSPWTNYPQGALTSIAYCPSGYELVNYTLYENVI